MTEDDSLAADLTSALLAYGRNCYAVLHDDNGVSDLRLRIHYAKGGYRDCLVSSYGLMDMRSKSHHQALKAEAFEAERCHDMKAIVAIVQQVAPALCAKDVSIALDLYGPTDAGSPRYKLEVDTHEIHPQPCTAPALVKKLLGRERKHS